MTLVTSWDPTDSPMAPEIPGCTQDTAHLGFFMPVQCEALHEVLLSVEAPQL